MDTEIRLDLTLHCQDSNEHDAPFWVIKGASSGTIARRIGKFGHVKKVLEGLTSFSDPFGIEFGSLFWHDYTSVCLSFYNHTKFQ